MATSSQIATAEALVCYLLRGLRARIDYDKIGASRRRSLAREMSDYLVPAAVSARSTEEWARLVCDRFEIEPTGQGWIDGEGREVSGSPAYALIPRRFLPAGTIEIGHRDATEGIDGIACVRWDHMVRQIPFDALRIALDRNPNLIVTFATNPSVEGEETLFASASATTAVQRWTCALPKRLQTPRAFRTVLTLTSPCSHGADHKSGNVTMFRRQRYVDPTTGEQYMAPFIAGNAGRGILRDQAAGIQARDVGLKLAELEPRIAHALLAGGTIEAGADGASVDVAFRRRVRALIPMWDLFAGVMQQQIMRGVLRWHDYHLVCRENAWLLHTLLSPKRAGSDTVMPFDEFREALEPADNFTQLRLLTRHAHREIDGSDGMQMLTETEVLLPGAQLVHGFQIVDLDGVSSLTKSFLRRLLDDFRDNAFIGAGNARGLGGIAFDPYKPGDPALELPSEDEYLAFVAERREEIRSFLLGESGGAASPARGKGRGKRAATPEQTEGSA